MGEHSTQQTFLHLAPKARALWLRKPENEAPHPTLQAPHSRASSPIPDVPSPTRSLSRSLSP
ncbi:MAG: hypothetical protein IKH26_12970 [Bacteroidaceae bacterium]|nr:hypothetical protein [Bacteroidaceae bacterium]